MNEFNFLYKIGKAFVVAYLSVFSLTNAMSITHIFTSNPEKAYYMTILFIGFIWASFVIYAFKIIVYEIVYTVKKAAKDATE